MKNVAWVGNREAFRREFKTQNNYSVDHVTDTTYWLINNMQSVIGQRFNVVESHFSADTEYLNNYYSGLRREAELRLITE